MATLMGIDDTIRAVLDCVAVALEDAEAPVCSVSTTIGAPAIASCCDCGDGEGELWGSLVRIYRMGATSGGYPDARMQRPCMPSEWASEFTITLARCFPTIDERGDLPSPEDRAEAARNLHSDMATIQRAIHCCTSTEVPYITRISIESDPSGGCSYVTATVQVPVSLKKSDNPRA